MFQGSGFRVQGSGFRVQGSGFRIQGSGFWVQGSGFRIQDSGFRVQGSGFRVQGSGFRVQVKGSNGTGLRDGGLPGRSSFIARWFMPTYLGTALKVGDGFQIVDHGA